jgi:hypothetical protein
MWRSIGCSAGYARVHKIDSPQPTRYFDSTHSTYIIISGGFCEPLSLLALAGTFAEMQSCLLTTSFSAKKEAAEIAVSPVKVLLAIKGSIIL